MLTFHHYLLACLYACLLTLSSVALADDDDDDDDDDDHEVHWGYSGEGGPGHWSELSDDFVACGEGKNQSPINILNKDVVPAKMAPIPINYPGKTTSILNNGHTLQVNVEPGNSVQIEGETYHLLQFHFHTPSEHEIDGERFPLEIHFVHKNDKGEIAVLGGVYREGKESERLSTIVDKAPKKAGESAPFVVAFQDYATFDELTDFYHYSGSLTTPPCTEGLRWYVYPLVATISRDQIAEYIKMIGYDARGVQPLNARRVLRRAQ